MPDYRQTFTRAKYYIMNDALSKMFAPLRRFYNEQTANDHESSLNTKVYNNLVIIAMAVTFLTIIQNIILDINWQTSAVTLVALAALTILYIINNKTRYRAISKLSFLVLAYTSLVYIWLQNGGFGGPIGIFFFAILVFSLFFLDEHRYFAIVMNLCAIAFALIFNYHYPELINGYSSIELQVLDYGISYVLLAVSIFIIARIITTEYRREEMQVRNQKKRLEALNLQLEKMAYYDHLTGVANRRLFMQQLSQKLSAKKLNNDGFCLIIADLDFFKKINDRYGHSIGDQVLKAFTQHITKKLDKNGFLARLGGEEFAIIVHSNNLRESRTIATTILNATRAIEVNSLKNEPVAVTVSLGLTMAKKGDTADTIMHRADDALYRSKNNGRNRFSVNK